MYLCIPNLCVPTRCILPPPLLYADPALDQCLDVTLQLALCIPATELVSFPKVAASYYALIEVLFRNHLKKVRTRIEGIDITSDGGERERERGRERERTRQRKRKRQ